MRPKFLYVAAVAAVAAVFGSATLASGQATTTTPLPGCQGVQVVDPKADNSQPVTDILNIWWDHVEGKTYANLQVADLKLETPDGTAGWLWSVQFDFGESTYLLVAYNESDGSQTFVYKELVGVYFVGTTAVPGTIFPGKNGVVRWEVPADIGGAVGSTLEGTYGEGEEVTNGDPITLGAILRIPDSADDTADSTAKPYTVKPCEAGSTPPAGPTPPSQPPKEPAPPTTAPAPTNTGDGQPRALDVTVSRKVPRARKVRKALKLGLTSGSGATDLTAVLVRSGKVVARGKLARLGQRGTLKLRVLRKLKKGTYTLNLSGRNADGSGGTATAKLRFK